ncbi:hypothetical protein I203_100939 [Kwoniella mangroviensis CBS 8507]|uniref:uncharacterized protein n=1 Tax=Kwoniella mangroviensis CBS 8507 TaxID=1296122 RepID=UPI0030544C56
MSTSTIPRLAQQLVSALVPELGDDRASTSSLTNRVVRDIRADVQGGARKEWEDIKHAIQGLSRTAKVRIQEDLAEALKENLKALERCREKGKGSWEGDEQMKMSNLPQYVHLLLNLSDKPTLPTHEFAYSYLHRSTPSGPTADQILYEEIMDSEPFDPGEIWDEEVLSGWTDSEDEYDRDFLSEGSNSEGSPEEDYVKTPSSATIRAQRKRDDENRRKRLEEGRREEALEVVRGLKDGYWNRPGMGHVIKEGSYGWRDLVTQSSTASLAAKAVQNRPVTDKVISSTQLQREILFALSGRSGVVFHFSDKGVCYVIPNHPQVNHLSSGSMGDILITFQKYANQAASIRRFILETLQPNQIASTNRSSQAINKPKGPNKTQQAFAGVCQIILSDFDLWLSELECSFIQGIHKASTSSQGDRSSSASTPSSLLLALDRRYSVVLDLLASFIPHSNNSTILLNLILTTINTFDHSAFNEQFDILYDIFIETANPVWEMLRIWIQHGMPIPSSFTDTEEAYTTSIDEGTERALEDEFFIKRDRDVSWADEDFYECGYVVDEYGWPEWLGEELGEIILEAGKARGLLKSLLGGMGMVEDWQDLRELLRLDFPSPNEKRSKRPEGVNVVEKISGYLMPMCQLIQFHLRRVLDEECGVDDHLDAIEGVMYHRGYDVLDGWSKVLFDKVSSNAKWTDFQTLTSTFRDVVEEKQAGWMNPAAIRIRTIRSSGALVGPRALEILRVNYEVPFPLSQLFSSTSIELRAEVFTFLLQLRMARYLLIQTKEHDRELVAKRSYDGEREVRAMWMMRQKLLWFIDTIYIWLTDRIIEVQNIDFRRKLSEMTSLKSMISVELQHTRKMRNHAFLHPSTSEIYEDIQDIFDLTHLLWECYTSYMVQTPSKPDPLEEFVTRRKPRNRRKKKIHAISSDEDDEGEVAREASISFVELSLGDRMNKMDQDLDGLVSQVRDGIDMLAMGSEGEEDGWSMLAFALEEWK